jgi:hypothetical protein
MKITTLEANFRSVEGLEILLSKCPLVQKLSIKNYDQEMKELVLKDLTYLELFWCGSQFMTSFLNQANKSSLNTVHIRQESKVLNECKISVISKMDKLVVTRKYDYFTSTKDEKKQALENVVKMFPSDVEVRSLAIRNQTKFIFFLYSPS